MTNLIFCSQAAAWLAHRQSAIVGKDLAERYHWKIGDRIPLMSPIWEPKDPWEFTIAGGQASHYVGIEGAVAGLTRPHIRT